MGQNQLLFIAMSVIIVGVGVSVGIEQMGESALTANWDAVAADCQRIVSSSQQWFRKPTSLGGGGNSFTGMTLSDLGTSATNQNGSYALTVTNGTQFSVVGTGNEKNDAGSNLAVTLEFFATNDSTSYTDNL